MFYVYILFSSSKSKYYIGQTSDIEDRLNRHNSGFSLSTKYGIPWKLIQTFICNNRNEAILLEKKIKKRGAKRYLEDLGKNLTDITSRPSGKAAGSNPATPTNDFNYFEVVFF